VGTVAAVAAGVVVLDQLTKQWALDALADGPIDVVGSLRFNLSFNSGTAFSIGQGRGGLISLAGLVVVALLLRGVLRWPGRLPAVAAGLVAGGAIGNLLDRLLREGDGLLGGRVVDFVDLQWWPIFNVADVAICTGAALLAVVGSRQPPG
jgi:signal peptidase II